MPLRRANKENEDDPGKVIELIYTKQEMALVLGIILLYTGTLCRTIRTLI